MPAFVPGLENDVFISYAHIDNRASDWVTTLETQLRYKVSEFIGQDVSVWRDAKLAGNDHFDDVIARQVIASAVFVAVVSPRYVQSASCQKEYQSFAAGKSGARIGEKSRIARVRKTVLPEGMAEPPELSADETLGFPFFDSKGGQLVEFDNRAGMTGHQQFLARVAELAGAIAKVLRLLQKDARPRNDQRVIFLADTSQRLVPSRDELRRELVGRGHTVVPDRPLVTNGVFDPDGATAAVERAELAIHLFGGSYGLIPEGEERSLPHLEYVLAAAKRVPQLVWVPSALPEGGTRTADVRLGQLIDEIQQTETDSPRMLDVCTTEFETFKEIVLDALSRPTTHHETPTDAKSVYLLFHDSDLDSMDLRALRRHLLNAGYPVNLPAFEGSETELRQLEEQSFLDNDATLIYYGNAKDSWVEQKRKFLLSALGRAEHGRRARRALCLRPPTTRVKELKFGDFAGGRPLPDAKGFAPLFVVGDFDALSSEKLAPLLDWLSK